MEEIVSKIVGTQFYPESKKVLNILKENDELQLVREPDNKHDANAVAIYYHLLEKGVAKSSSEKYGKTHPVKIGHINAYQAEVVAPIMDKKEFEVKCIVKEVTGHTWLCPNSLFGKGYDPKNPEKEHSKNEISMDILNCPQCGTHIRRARKLKRFRGCNISIQLSDRLLEEGVAKKDEITEKAEDMSDDELDDMINELEEKL